MSAQPVEQDYDVCGTYAGVSAHKRDRTRMCPACRAANTAYMREYRKRKPDGYQREKAKNHARERALWKLADLHPAQFRVLVEAELKEAGLR